MSPTIFREGQYRFFFFSREENRVHVHVTSPEGEAKFWIEPQIVLVSAYGLSEQKLSRLHKVIEKRKDEILAAWTRHFSR